MSKSPNTADVAFGARVRAARLLAGLTQEKLADACGITFQQIQKYEKGVNRVGYSRMEQIASAVGMTPRQLLPSPEALDAPSTVVNLISAGAGIADAGAVRLYLELPVGARRAIQDAIEALHTAHFPHAQAAE